MMSLRVFTTRLGEHRQLAGLNFLDVAREPIHKRHQREQGRNRDSGSLTLMTLHRSGRSDVDARRSGDRVARGLGDPRYSSHEMSRASWPLTPTTIAFCP